MILSLRRVLRNELQVIGMINVTFKNCCFLVWSRQVGPERVVLCSCAKTCHRLERRSCWNLSPLMYLTISSTSYCLGAEALGGDLVSAPHCCGERIYCPR